MNSVKRLYTQFRPKNYKIEVKPNIETKTFTGKVIITGLKVGPTSSRITLHQINLRILKAKVNHQSKTGNSELKIARINYQKKSDELRLHFDSKIRSGDYVIELEFKGKITDDLSGMYISSNTVDGKTHKIVTTQFESHAAREVFPCIDEPEAKATFDLSIIHDSKSIVISNTPIKTESKLAEGETKTTFNVTPVMSTYLLAFIVGDFAFKQSKTKNGTVVRSYATPDKIDYVDFSLEIAVKSIDFYNQYFDIPYPLEKCDLIALPDFSAGAMENWGCITFREQAMLVDPKRSSLANKQYVAMVVAHELAHQWFGNLVTMKWWSDLWLNEGFASWMEFFTVNNLYPEWNLWTQFLVDEQQIAFSLDSLENTHPIEVKIKHPDEIRTIFDSISYSKGASIIHMLHSYVGADNFRKGLQDYLKKYSYKNTETKDLWNAISHASNISISGFMSDWTTKSGYPIVSVNLSPNKLTLSQRRFSYLPNNDDNETWPIPLLSNTNNQYLSEIFDKKSQTYNGNFKMVKLNNGQTGFYRTIYDDKDLSSLGKLVKESKLGVGDRLGLLSDLVESSKADLSDITKVLDLIENYQDETNYAVWDIISLTIGSIKAIICDEDLREKIKPLVSDLVSTEVKRLGLKELKNEDHFDTLLRPIILGLASSCDDKVIVDFCKQQFKLMSDKSTASKVNPDFKGFILGTMARIGGEKEYQQMIKMHNETNLAEERTTLISTISSFRQSDLIEKNLKFMTSDKVRSQDISYWIAYSFGNRFAKDKTWDWLKENWKWLETILGNDLSYFRMPIYAARAYSDNKFLKKYKEFFEPIITPSFVRTYKQGLEIINIQASWREKSYDKLKSYLSSYKSPK
jgi:aminopeptidase N